MNTDNPTNRDESVINSDERRGMNESTQFENAKNDYQNNEPVLNEANNTASTTNADNAATNKEVEEDIKPLENGHQEKPGSSGAFPVGAFDTSKD